MSALAGPYENIRMALIVSTHQSGERKDVTPTFGSSIIGSNGVGEEDLGGIECKKDSEWIFPVTVSGEYCSCSYLLQDVSAICFYLPNRPGHGGAVTKLLLV